LPQKPRTQTYGSRTLCDSTRSVILGALQDSGWVIGGPAGAATRLGLPRTSLISKMRKLGIMRPKSASLNNIFAETIGSPA
jgi:transcriptional regulator with GAF, ATPase, and Fis domain